MNRRDFIALLGGAAAWPLAARAQQQPIPVIGLLRSSPASGSMHLVAAFHRGLEEAGFVEGQNVTIEYRWADGHLERLPALAADLIRRPVAVIVANQAAAQAAKAATAAVPIVFTTGADPVRIGLVESLSRPGRNVTGVVFTVGDLTAKRLGLLHELVPNSFVLAVLLDPNAPASEEAVQGVEEARRTIGRRIEIVKAVAEHELDAAFGTIVQARAGALLVGGGPLFLGQRRRLVDLAARHGLPASYVTREYPEAGGLMSYGPSLTEAYRKAGVYAARILKGARPADLPVEQATKFDLIINLQTAKALGLTVPPSLLALADEVIE
jgi:putative ABC transport system substrate-binding protein